MEFYGNLRSHLARNARSNSNQMESDINDPDFLSGDRDLFEQSLKQRRSIFAVHEQIRASHTLLKSAIDGVQ